MSGIGGHCIVNPCSGCIKDVKIRRSFLKKFFNLRSRGVSCAVGRGAMFTWLARWTFDLKGAGERYGDLTTIQVTQLILSVIRLSLLSDETS